MLIFLIIPLLFLGLVSYSNIRLNTKIIVGSMILIYLFLTRYYLTTEQPKYRLVNYNSDIVLIEDKPKTNIEPFITGMVPESVELSGCNAGDNWIIDYDMADSLKNLCLMHKECNVGDSEDDTLQCKINNNEVDSDSKLSQCINSNDMINFISNNWLTYCRENPNKCKCYDMSNKEQFINFLNSLRKWVSNINDSQLESWRTFVTKLQISLKNRRVVKRSIHKHRTMGELKYHLKALDSNIYDIVNNNLGADINPIIFAKNKLDKFLEHRTSMGDDKTNIRLKLTLQILQSIIENYQQTFSANNSKFFVDDKCKEIEGSDEYNLDNDLLSLTRIKGECPDNHYLSGARLEKTWEYGSNGMRKILTCCPLKGNESGCNTVQDQEDVVDEEDSIPNTSDLTNITKIRNSCPSNKYLKGFEYIKPSSSIQNTQEINIITDNYIYLVPPSNDTCTGELTTISEWRNCCDPWNGNDFDVKNTNNCLKNLNNFPQRSLIRIDGIDGTYNGIYRKLNINMNGLEYEKMDENSNSYLLRKYEDWPIIWVSRGRWNIGLRKDKLNNPRFFSDEIGTIVNDVNDKPSLGNRTYSRNINYIENILEENVEEESIEFTGENVSITVEDYIFDYTSPIKRLFNNRNTTVEIMQSGVTKRVHRKPNNEESFILEEAENGFNIRTKTRYLGNFYYLTASVNNVELILTNNTSNEKFIFEKVSNTQNSYKIKCNSLYLIWHSTNKLSAEEYDSAKEDNFIFKINTRLNIIKQINKCCDAGNTGECTIIKGPITSSFNKNNFKTFDKLDGKCPPNKYLKSSYVEKVGDNELRMVMECCDTYPGVGEEENVDIDTKELSTPLCHDHNYLIGDSRDIVHERLDGEDEQCDDNIDDKYKINSYPQYHDEDTLEIHIGRGDTWLNDNIFLSKGQKLLINMIYYKLNNMHKIKLDENSLYEFFNKNNNYNINNNTVNLFDHDNI